MRSPAARQTMVAAGLAFAFALACASGVPGLTDPDAFSHLAYARRLWESGFALRGHPFLPFTVLGDTGVDLWWGFHLLLLPFLPLGDLWGARLAGACIAATVAGSLAFLLQRAGRSTSWPFAIAPVMLSEAFAIRAHVARPALLTIPIVLFELACGAGLFSPLVAGVLAFACGLVHLSSPLAAIFCFIGLAGARLAREPGSARALLWSVGGLGLSYLVRPDRALYLTIALMHNLSALGVLSQGKLPHESIEIFAPGAAQFLGEAWPGALLVVLALWLGRGAASGSRALRTGALMALGLALLLTLRALRMIDYLAPLCAYAAGLCWRLHTWAHFIKIYLNSWEKAGALQCGL